jgi:small-conductance mechanosensitive channel
MTIKKTLPAILVFLFLISAAASDDSAPAQQGETQRIVSFLNQTIVWYRQQIALQQVATEPSDVLYVNQNRELADEILRQSFDFARGRAQILAATSANSPANTDSNSPTARYQSTVAVANRLDQQLKETQSEADDVRRRLQTATGRTRTHLEASLAELQSEIELLQTRRDVMRNMVQFLSSTSTNALGTGTLQSQIDELARTVPVVLTSNEKSAANQNASNTTQAAAAAQRKAQPSGILALVTDLISLQRKKDTIQQSVDSANSLMNESKAIRAPLVTELRALLTQGNELFKAADTADPATLEQQKKQLDALTAQFKQYSAAVLPLGKQSILLDVYKRTLGNWESSVGAQYGSELKGLILRLAILAMLIGLIAGVSEIWRKATFRYVHDTRRRYQFLLLRRIVVWMVIAIVVAFAFAEELGTLATFAGLLTAGVAVALQSVILSVAGYFLLIGRYGVRVGDRVQIGGVTGDVIEIGLVRIHIMEAISGASDVRPTGRVVAFSNAIVFQPNAGLFKQIPGTNFVWHEITLTLVADSNYQQIEDRLMDAVRKIYAGYKDELEVQRRHMEKSLTGVSIRALGAESRLRLTQSGLEVVIRYPVVLSNATAVDDEMTRALLDAISREPRLKLVGTGTPNIQAVPETATT